jgi:hypothetical protein
MPSVVTQSPCPGAKSHAMLEDNTISNRSAIEAISANTSSNVAVQADLCSAAVSVSTPSRSKRTASTWSEVQVRSVAIGIGLFALFRSLAFRARRSFVSHPSPAVSDNPVPWITLHARTRGSAPRAGRVGRSDCDTARIRGRRGRGNSIIPNRSKIRSHVQIRPVARSSSARRRRRSGLRALAVLVTGPLWLPRPS